MRCVCAVPPIADLIASDEWRECAACKREFAPDARLALALAWRAAAKGGAKETLRAEANLASCYMESARFGEAERIYRDVLEASARAFGAADHATLAGSANLACVLNMQGKFAEAERLNRAALAAAQHAGTPACPDVLTCKLNLATSLSHAGKHEEAEKVYREVIPQLAPFATRREMLLATSNFGMCLTDRGKHAEAERIHAAVLHARAALLGAEHSDTLASSNNLTVALSSQGKHAEATKIQRALLATQARVLGDEHPSTLATKVNLATSLKGQKMYAEAECLYVAALAAERRVLGDENPATFPTCWGLFELLLFTDRREEAETALRDVLARQLRTLGAAHGDTRTSLDALAIFTERDERAPALCAFCLRAGASVACACAGPACVACVLMVAAARGEWTRCHVCAAAFTGAARVELVAALVATEEGTEAGAALAAQLMESGAFSEAETVLRLVHRAQAAAHGPCADATLATAADIGVAMYATGKYEHAELVFRNVIADRSGERTLPLVNVEANLAACLGMRGAHREAEAIQRRTHAAHVRLLGDGHRDTIASMANLAHTRAARGKHKLAYAMQLRVAHALGALLGGEHAATLAAEGDAAVTRWSVDGSEQALIHNAERCARVLGAAHPATARADSSLARVRVARGTRVVVRGITQRPELNGREGRVAGYIGARYAVQLDSGGVVSLRPQSLAPIKIK